MLLQELKNKTNRESTMNTLIRWNPFRTGTWDPFKDIQEFEQRLASTFGRAVAKHNGEEAITTADWAPLVDITEDDKEFLVKAELPGLKKEEIKVTVENGVMTISGERKIEKEEKTKKCHRIERSYGKFERSFSLPDKADGLNLNADFKDGILQVHLPKTEKPASKTLEVKIS
jgi:HSP20 family protein